MSDNFIPTMSGPINYRPGFTHIPYRQRSLWGRLVAWWRGEPVVVSSLIVYGQPQVLYVATDKGMFYMDEKSQTLKPMSFTQPTPKED